MTKETCAQIEPMLAAYALEALDPEDRLRVDVHLAACPRCCAVLEEYQAVSEELALAVPPLPPPSGLRRRLAAQVASRRRPSLRWRAAVLAGGRAVMWLAVLVLLVLQVLTLQRTAALDETARQLAAQTEAYQTALALLTYPDTRVVVLHDGTAYGTLVYRPDDTVAVLSVEGLEIPPPSKAYQLWLIQPDGTRVSGGVFVPSVESGFTVLVVRAPQPVGRFVGAGVTVEPASGSPGPTGPRVLGGDL